jgi:hypothetical protein
MTANSPSSVAESASSTGDPDTQARRVNDGKLSAGFRSNLTIDGPSRSGGCPSENCCEHLRDGPCSPTISARDEPVRRSEVMAVVEVGQAWRSWAGPRQ